VTCSGHRHVRHGSGRHGQDGHQRHPGLSSAQAGNYALSATTATTTANITAATLTPAITASNKTYDGTSSATISCTLTGVVGSRRRQLQRHRAPSTRRRSARARRSRAATLALGGAQAGNYALSATTATTTANITAGDADAGDHRDEQDLRRDVERAISCTLTGVVGSDVVSCSGTGSFDTAAVGTGKTVTSGNLALGGARPANYALSATTATTTANITAATLTPAITAANKTYDGTSAAAIAAR
jgi:hypothetical protein